MDSAARTLAIDIGGSHLKAGMVDIDGALIAPPVRAETPQPATPRAVLEQLEGLLRPLGAPDRIAAGFPGVVRSGVVRTAPNLGTPDWSGFPLADRLAALLGAPARVENDATVQGLGAIEARGLECVITLGTGLGFALFRDGVAAPHLEMNLHPVRGRRTYNDYIGNAERLRVGNKRWNRRMSRVIGILRTLVSFDTLLIGGGNTRHLTFDLPEDVRIVPNEAGITGGVWLWQQRCATTPTPAPAPGR